MSVLTLGVLTFEGFEVPGRIRFGGAQQLSVHKLLGGARVIDVLGRDDAVLSWSGILSGVDAAERARSLDAVRASGVLQTLSWDAFCYSVIIKNLDLDFCNPWWIPYRIRCLVERDLAQSDIENDPSAVSAVISDLNFAASVVAPAISALFVNVPSLVNTGVSGQRQAKVDVATAQAAVEAMIASSAAGLESDDLGELVTSSGTISNLCYAKGLLERSFANISSMEF